MKNFIITYRVKDKNSEEKFAELLTQQFIKNRVFQDNLKYFAFAGRELTDVQDRLQEMMDHLSLIDSDYIALFYTRKEEPDDIKRLMVFGKSNLIEKELNKLNERTLADLLEFDFIKQH